MTQVLEPPKEGKLKFALSDFEWLSEQGFFNDWHVELLNGEIFVKGQQGFRHAQAVRALNEQFVLGLQTKAYTSSQCPMVLHNPPPDFVEPDLALLHLPKEQYGARDVNNTDAYLVIEVSDSTLGRDQTEKLEAYATNGIPEYWIYNLNAGWLEVYRAPNGKSYADVQKYGVGQMVAPLEFPDFLVQWWV